MAVFESNDPDAAKKMRQMIGPGQVDEQIRQAISPARDDNFAKNTIRPPSPVPLIR